MTPKQTLDLLIGKPVISTVRSNLKSYPVNGVLVETRMKFGIAQGLVKYGEQSKWFLSTNITESK